MAEPTGACCHDGETAPTTGSAGLRRRQLFGLAFIDAHDLSGVVADLATLAVGSDPRVVITPNVDIIVQLDRPAAPAVQRTMQRATHVLPDGMPIVWASRLLGRPLGRRLPGSALLATIWPVLVRDQRSVVVIAPSDDVAALVRAEHPEATVIVPPMFDRNDAAQVEQLAHSVATAVVPSGTTPEYVIVALGFPKHALVVDALIEHPSAAFTTSTYLCIGGGFEMYYGLKPRAPVWMQRVGLEWFHRFLLEPRRLFRRYFLDDPAFARIVWQERRRLSAPGGS